MFALRRLQLLPILCCAILAPACVDLTGVGDACPASWKLDGHWTATLAQREMDLQIQEKCVVHLFESSDTTLTVTGTWAWNGLGGSLLAQEINGQPAIMLDIEASSEYSREVVMLFLAKADLPAKGTLPAMVSGTFHPPGQRFPFTGSFNYAPITLKRR